MMRKNGKSDRTNIIIRDSGAVSSKTDNGTWTLQITKNPVLKEKFPESNSNIKFKFPSLKGSKKNDE